MVGVAQLVELRIVIPVVAGSNPVAHPISLFPRTWLEDAFHKSCLSQKMLLVSDAWLTTRWAFCEAVRFAEQRSQKLAC